MWDPLFEPGIGLLNGSMPHLRALAQELTQEAVHHRGGVVLWCDGDHGFNPYAFAEANMLRGFSAEDGADRVLVKRCMTPFQWDTVLTRHLGEKLEESEAALVIVLPYDRLFGTDELKDWERRDYVAYSLKHLRGLAHRHRVPILLGADVARWRWNHLALARRAWVGVDRRWSVLAVDGHLRVAGADDLAGPMHAAVRQSRLTDFHVDVGVEQGASGAADPAVHAEPRRRGATEMS